MPEDKQLNKIKLSKELIENIFECYKFVSISKTSSIYVIFKNTVNAFFGRNIITNKRIFENSYDVEMTISEKNREWFNFALKYLRNYKPEQMNDDDLFMDEEVEDIIVDIKPDATEDEDIFYD